MVELVRFVGLHMHFVKAEIWIYIVHICLNRLAAVKTNETYCTQPLWLLLASEIERLIVSWHEIFF